MGPAQLSTQCVDNFLGLEHLAEAQHMTQVLGAEAAPVFGFQLSRQRSDDLFAVAGPLPLEHLGAYAPANAPVQHGQGRIDRGGQSGPRFIDQNVDVAGQASGPCCNLHVLRFHQLAPRYDSFSTNLLPMAIIVQYLYAPCKRHWNHVRSLSTQTVVCATNPIHLRRSSHARRSILSATSGTT
jgi:hypothetical protein